jgi:hypothetical protein
LDSGELSLNGIGGKKRVQFYRNNYHTMIVSVAIIPRQPKTPKNHDELHEFLEINYRRPSAANAKHHFRGTSAYIAVNVDKIVLFDEINFVINITWEGKNLTRQYEYAERPIRKD